MSECFPIYIYIPVFFKGVGILHNDKCVLYVVTSHILITYTTFFFYYIWRHHPSHHRLNHCFRCHTHTPTHSEAICYYAEVAHVTLTAKVHLNSTYTLTKCCYSSVVHVKTCVCVSDKMNRFVKTWYWRRGVVLRGCFRKDRPFHEKSCISGIFVR